MPWALVLAAAVCGGGCEQNVSATPVQSTGGTLCYSDFQSCVSPVFNAQIRSATGSVVSCDIGSGCHEYSPPIIGAGGNFRVIPNALPDNLSNCLDSPTATDMCKNFQSALREVNLDQPDDSLLLLKPSAMGRAFFVHGGGNIFPNGQDACYVAIKTWISHRVASADDASCGGCTPPNTSVCGYP